MTDDRRRFARIGFDAPAWIERAGVAPEAVTVVDLSFKGALVKVTDAACHTPGERCELVVTLGEDEACIRMGSELKHIEGALLGLACVDLDLDSVTHLRRLIALNLGDPALLERDLKALVSA